MVNYMRYTLDYGDGKWETKRRNPLCRIMYLD